MYIGVVCSVATISKSSVTANAKSLLSLISHLIFFFARNKTEEQFKVMVAITQQKVGLEI